jgi:hypothetical protein
LDKPQQPPTFWANVLVRLLHHDFVDEMTEPIHPPAAIDLVVVGIVNRDLTVFFVNCSMS